MDEKHELISKNESLDFTSSASVFTKEVKPLSKKRYFLNNLISGIVNLILKAVDFIVTIFVSLFLVAKTAGLGFYHGVLGIINFFKFKAHQFVHNDKWGRLSFFFFGFGNLMHKQIVIGITYLVFEIGFFVGLVVKGFKSIGLLSSLGLRSYLVDKRNYDNSIVILIEGLIWLIIVILFIYIWNRSINSGYRNYRIVNFVTYENYLLDAIPASKLITEKALATELKLKTFSKENQGVIEGYIDEYSKVKNDKQAVSFYSFLLSRTIKHAYKFKKQEKKLSQRINRLSSKEMSIIRLIQKRYDHYEALFNENKDNLKLEAKVGYTHSLLLSKQSSFDTKISKFNHKLDELRKRFSSFAETEETRNNNVYGKFNNYYKEISRIDNELLYLRNYFKFVDKYTSSLGGHEQQNQTNKEALVTLKNDCEAKIAASRAKFDGIRQRRVELESLISKTKKEYEDYAKLHKDDTEGILREKEKLVTLCTRLHGELKNLPSAHTVKTMEKEEIKESRHSYLRDRKFLKTNFTYVEYARQQVIDYMIVDFKMAYKDAYINANKLIKGKTGKEFVPFDKENIDMMILSLEEEKNAYKEKHQDKFVGHPEGFKETIRSLMDSKFHVTILALPILGIFMMTIFPLIFSIVVAFTNFGKDGTISHVPPALFTWVGFDNFIKLFSMSESDSGLGVALMSTVGWTFLWAIAATFSNYILGIIVALMINKADIKFKKFWRTVFVLTIAIPQFISLLAISIMLKKGYAIDELWSFIFGSRLGFADSNNIPMTKFIIILINVWVGIPYTMLSTTGILMNIPKDLYESSEVDGAGKFTQFTRITMPYILFVTGPYLITQFVGNINNFNVIFFLSGDVTAHGTIGSEFGLKDTDLLITFLYSLITSANKPRYGLASIIGIFIFAICAFFSLIMYSKSGAIQEEDQFQ